MTLLQTVAVVIAQRQPADADMLAEARAALNTVAGWLDRHGGLADPHRDVAKLLRSEAKK